jgi:hypothetical protein
VWCKRAGRCLPGLRPPPPPMGLPLTWEAPGRVETRVGPAIFLDDVPYFVRRMMHVRATGCDADDAGVLQSVQPYMVLRSFVASFSS